MNCFDFSTPFKRLERNATALSLNRPYSLKVEKSQTISDCRLIWFLRDDPACKMCPGKKSHRQKMSSQKAKKNSFRLDDQHIKTLMTRTRWKFIFHLQVVPIRLGKLNPK